MNATKRRVLMVASMLFFLRRSLKEMAACIQNEKLIGSIQSLSAYSVSELCALLKEQPPGHKVYCFVRGLIHSRNSFSSALAEAKKLVCSVVFKTHIYSNRPKEIIDGLDFANKVLLMKPRVAAGLQLADITGPETARLVASSKQKFDFVSALSEVASISTPLPSSFLQSIRSLLARVLQPFLMLGRLFRGAPIREVLVELGIRENSHVFVLGSCSLDGQGLQIEAELATKDPQLYVGKLSKFCNKHVVSLLLSLFIFWLLTIVFSRDLQELYAAVQGWFRVAEEPEEQQSDSEDGAHSCYICCSRIRCIVFRPCRHYGICRTCYESLESKQCPTCKADIDGVIRIDKRP